MLKLIIKRIVCEHDNMILSKVKGEGLNTVFFKKCLCCGYVITDTIKVKTK